MYAHVIRGQKLKKNALNTSYRSVQMYTHTSSAIRVLHPPSALNRSLLDFDVCGQKRMANNSNTIIILIEINHKITEYVCKNPHLFHLCLSQDNGAKITRKTWVSDAVELDIYVLCQCYTYLLLCFIVLN